MKVRRKVYETPLIEEWTIAGLTQVGQTNPGGDILPGASNGKEDGSVFPPGLTTADGVRPGNR